MPPGYELVLLRPVIIVSVAHLNDLDLKMPNNSLLLLQSATPKNRGATYDIYLFENDMLQLSNVEGVSPISFYEIEESKTSSGQYDACPESKYRYVPLLYCCPILLLSSMTTTFTIPLPEPYWANGQSCA